MDDPPGPIALRGTVARKIAGVRALPPADLALIAIAWGMLSIASLLVALLPSRLILRWLGHSSGATPRAPALDGRERGRARRIARAVAVAARHAPFRADCYPQALTAAQLCRWSAVPHAVHLGARFAAGEGDRLGKLEGHAWVCSEGVTLCGGPASHRRFGTVACFVHDPGSVGGDAVA